MSAELRLLPGAHVPVIDRPGDGAPIVIVPGVMADGPTWQGVAAALDTGSRVVTVNRRGREPGPPLGDGYSVETEVADLVSVLDAVGPAHLFGWSYGGLVAAETATRVSGLESLTLYEPVSRPFAPEALPALRAAAADGDLDRIVELVNTDVSGFSSDYVETLRTQPVWSILRQFAPSLAAELTAVDEHAPHYEAYGRIEVPTTLIIGTDNLGGAPYGTAFDRFRAAMPQAAVVNLVGQGHLAHVSAPEQLAAIISAAVRAARTPHPLNDEDDDS